MIYVYDTVIDSHTDTLKRYGTKYKLEKRFRMGNRRFISFVAPGMEKILVVPEFAEQYREVEEKYKKFGKGKTFESYLRLIKKQVDPRATVEEFPSDESDNGIVQSIGADYKDIHVKFEYMNNELRYNDEFEIRDSNLFGNGIIVMMNVDMEDA